MTNATPRVSPIQAPADYALPGRPEGASTALDAYRQTQFLLGGELELFAATLNLQVGLVREAYPSKFRTQRLAAMTALWSRVYMYLSDGLLLTTRGAYASTLPLMRGACEAIAAEVSLRSDEGMAEYDAWLGQSLRPNETHKAVEFELGRFYAGTVLATDAALGAIYRPAGDLGRPNFGASLLQVAPESNNNRLAISFADAAFHLGWAELALGWLLALSVRQLRVVVEEAEGVFPVSDEARSAYEDVGRRVEAALGRADRCFVEEVVDGNDRRYLVHNFRRTSGGAPKKVIL